MGPQAPDIDGCDPAHALSASTIKIDTRRDLLSQAQRSRTLPDSYYLNGVRREATLGLRGIGGFGDVHLGSWNDKNVALKVFRFLDYESQHAATSELSSTSLLYILFREVILWKQLDHAHIQPLLGVSRTALPPRLALVSEWWSFGTINQALYLVPSVELRSRRLQWVSQRF